MVNDGGPPGERSGDGAYLPARELAQIVLSEEVRQVAKLPACMVRNTGCRGQELTVNRPNRSYGVVILSAVILVWTTAAAKDRDSLNPASFTSWQSPFVCGATDLQADALRLSVEPAQGLSAETQDGEMLWYQQNPPLLRADRRGGLSFEILIAGEIEEVAIERHSSQADGDVTNRWPRANQMIVGGRLVSVFKPTWSEAELWDNLAWKVRGYDSPGGFFGRLKVQGRSFWLHVRISPVNLPRSTAERINDSIQYASHVVNIAVPEPYFVYFRDLTRTFYEHFADEYESIAIVRPGDGYRSGGAAFHLAVQNPIGGLGVEVFDDSGDYGSHGTLRGIEGYNDLTFTWMSTSNHELGHTWADFWDWPSIANLDFGGCFDSAHYPPLYPGTSYVSTCMYGASLLEVGEGRFEVVGAAMPVMYNPATLYRMGLVGPEAVDEMIVFSWPSEQRWIPKGHVFDRGYRRVHINDIMARHGKRSGRVDSSWRRATIVVSRGELLSPEEMGYWNFFAARHAATEGVRAFNAGTSFHEATGGRARLHTDVTPKTRVKIISDFDVSDVPVDPREFPGVQLDEPIPALFAVGDSMVIAGTLTEHAARYERVCLTMVSSSAHFGLPGHKQRVEACGPIVGNRFRVSHEFTDNGSGVADQYQLRIHLVPPGAISLPPPVSSVSGISVDSMKIHRENTGSDLEAVSGRVTRVDGLASLRGR